VLFTPRRLKDSFSELSDIDGIGLTYQATLRHFHCLSSSGFQKLVCPAQDDPSQLEFRSDFYVHPNVRPDGWAEFRRVLSAKLTDPASAVIPSVPTQPKFWNEQTTGSETCKWPPACFNEWIKKVESGRTLQFVPTPGVVAALNAASVSSPSSTPDLAAATGDVTLPGPSSAPGPIAAASGDVLVPSPSFASPPVVNIPNPAPLPAFTYRYPPLPPPTTPSPPPPTAPAPVPSTIPVSQLFVDIPGNIGPSASLQIKKEMIETDLTG
jgi:hypothetical protein